MSGADPDDHRFFGGQLKCRRSTAPAKVNIPEGTQSGQQFRLRNKGMSVLQSKIRGDMYIDAQVEIPVKLTKRQKELLREFDNAGGDEGSHPRSEGFFDKVKDFWEDLTEVVPRDTPHLQIRFTANYPPRTEPREGRVMSGDLKFGILEIGAGRMGQMNIRQISMTDGCVLAGATGRPGSDVVGQDAGTLAGVGSLGVAITDDTAAMIAGMDVVVDFTLPDVAVEAARLAAQAGAGHHRGYDRSLAGAGSRI